MNRPPTVFLAEDNRADVYLIRHALEEQGLKYELLHAEDGEQAAKLMNRIGADLPCPDVLLLDLKLPKRTGNEVLGLLREHPVCAEIPVIVITSSLSPRDCGMAAELNVKHYFRKPSDLEQFLELGKLVKSVVEGGRSANAAS